MKAAVQCWSLNDKHLYSMVDRKKLHGDVARCKEQLHNINTQVDTL